MNCQSISLNYLMSEDSKIDNHETKTPNQPRKWSQILCLVPLYLLQLSYGMNSGFPAILTPQLKKNCSSFSINDNEESWIGMGLYIKL